ncbi:MAG: hypothetical protein WAV64_04535 [Candidatus Moraniibacteriota bacterium]
MEKKAVFLIFAVILLFCGGKTAWAVDNSVEEQIRVSLEANKSNQPAKNISLEDFVTMSKNSPKEEAETIADVSIRNAEISELKKNQLKLVFDVENKMELQADLVYGLELIKEYGEDKISIMDIRIFSEDKITVEKNKSVHREVIYQSPDYLSGDYVLWLKVKDESGLILASQPFKVNLAGSEKFIEQGNPCYLTIEGEEKKYNLAQGVDLKKTEKLFLNCQTKNLTRETITALPAIEFYQRDFYGKKTGEYEASQNEAITFAKDEEKLTKIAIPLPENPQAYDAKIVFKKDNNIVSNPTIAHFVLAGKSGTIINASLDKNDYKAGEKAQLTLLWTGPADFFFQSRTGGSFLVDPTFAVEFKAIDGTLCNKQLTYKTGEFKTVLDVPLEKVCVNPVVTIKLVDEGQTLYEKVITTESEKEPGKKSTAIERAKESDKLVWITSVLLFGLVLALASSSYLRRKKVKNISKTLIFILILGASFLVTGKTQALTKTLKGTAYYTPAPVGSRLALTTLTDCGFDFTGIPKCTPEVTTNCYINASLVMYGSERWGCYQDKVKFTYDLSSTSVNQGTQITATGSAIALNACSNGVTGAIAVNPKDDGNNANLGTVLQSTWFTEDKEHHEGSGYIFDTDGWSCGNYAARFYMAFVHGNGGGYFDDAIGYSIKNCCSQTCSTGPGCRASLANGVVTGGVCCSGSCYECNSGYYWNGSMCAANACVSTGCPATCATTCSGAVCGVDCGTQCYGTKTDGVCCVPSNSGCAASTCVGSTCNDGCNNIPGTKTDGVCCVPNNAGCVANTCVGSTCNDGCNNILGTKTDGVCCISNGSCTCTSLTCTASDCGKKIYPACIDNCNRSVTPNSCEIACPACNSGNWREVTP